MVVLATSAYDPTEQVVLWCLRRQAEGGADAERAIRRNLSHGGATGHGQRCFCALQALQRALAAYGRRRLQFAEVGAGTVTADEAALLGLLHAEQTGDEAEIDSRLCWLVRREGRWQCREALGRLLDALTAAYPDVAAPQAAAGPAA
ncbi:MAG TPA: hypothetical protein VNS22_07825 [Geminicoccus sp.]|uniref:hypothetical protein n=1 Tax=Geminicoccus sp. TaxID=2024832 RepID=UPI002C2FB3DB|nr:hypothetical protein [Geminicoccus sp.]HWL68281.1 hypothetical protein [Geminicoccus sp.]